VKQFTKLYAGTSNYLPRFASVTHVESPTTGTAPQDARSRRLPRLRSRRWALGLAVLAPLVLTGCKVPSFGAFPGATTQARTAYHLWQGFFIAGLVVGGFVLLLIVWAIFRYRRRSDAIPKQTQYHTVLEIIYTVVPIIIVLALFVFTFNAENIIDAPAAHPNTIINVKAFQWGWEFDYPGGARVIGATTEAPVMEIPVGVPVKITLASLDVIHGFYIPEFNFSRYAQPGYTNTFTFNVIHTGTFRGQCTQLCGLYHSLMFFYVHAVTPAQYQAWLASNAGHTITGGAGPTVATGQKNGDGY
jgi:cytochrome c oxidase subunit II